MTPNEATAAIILISSVIAEAQERKIPGAALARVHLEELSRYMTLLELDYVQNHAPKL